MAAALLIAIVVWKIAGGSGEHRVYASFGEALNVPNGALVQTAGVTVGKARVDRVEGGQAIVALDLADDVWPLPRGTTAQIRLSSISGNVNRRVELALGPRGAAPIPDGGVIGTAPSKPVELDEIYNTFGPQTRKRLRSGLRHLAGSLAGRTGDLNRGVAQLAPALEQAGGLMADLHRSRRSLTSLVRNGDVAMRVLGAKRAEVGETLELADATFGEFSRRTAAIQRTLSELPPALTQVTNTTRRLTTTLARLDGLVRDLAPGAARLRSFARVATPTIGRLRRTADQGDVLARSATAAAPDITELLDRGQPFVEKLTPIVRDVTPIAHCLRPYAPEVGGTLSNWASWNANYDKTSNISKIFVDANLAGELADSPDIKATDFSKFGIRYAALRPPGWIGHDPQYMPECGVGRAGVDPANDWEDRK